MKRSVLRYISRFLVNKVVNAFGYGQIDSIVQAPKNVEIILGKRVRPSEGLETVDQKGLVIFHNFVFKKEVFGDVTLF